MDALPLSFLFFSLLFAELNAATAVCVCVCVCVCVRGLPCIIIRLLKNNGIIQPV